jgi:hypothetical protein
MSQLAPTTNIAAKLTTAVVAVIATLGAAGCSGNVQAASGPHSPHPTGSTPSPATTTSNSPSSSEANATSASPSVPSMSGRQWLLPDPRPAYYARIRAIDAQLRTKSDNRLYADGALVCGFIVRRISYPTFLEMLTGPGNVYTAVQGPKVYAVTLADTDFCAYVDWMRPPQYGNP